jgi:hypothetical protein
MRMMMRQATMTVERRNQRAAWQSSAAGQQPLHCKHVGTIHQSLSAAPAFPFNVVAVDAQCRCS